MTSSAVKDTRRLSHVILHTNVETCRTERKTSELSCAVMDGWIFNYVPPIKLISRVDSHTLSHNYTHATLASTHSKRTIIGLAHCDQTASNRKGGKEGTKEGREGGRKEK